MKFSFFPVWSWNTGYFCRESAVSFSQFFLQFAHAFSRPKELNENVLKNWTSIFLTCVPDPNKHQRRQKREVRSEKRETRREKREERRATRDESREKRDERQEKRKEKT